MSVLYKCDRCGDLIHGEKLESYRLMEYDYDKKEYHLLDLCLFCEKELETWLKEDIRFIVQAYSTWNNGVCDHCDYNIGEGNETNYCPNCGSNMRGTVE